MVAADKARSLPYHEVHSSRTIIYQSWLERLSNDRRSSLFGLFVSDEKKSHDFDTRGQCYKTFLSVIYDFLY